MSTAKTAPSGETAIWARLIAPERNGLSPDAARAMLSIQFSEVDRARMLALAEKNSAGQLSEVERQELEGYVKVGDVLSLLHLKAKRSLQSG